MPLTLIFCSPPAAECPLDHAGQPAGGFFLEGVRADNPREHRPRGRLAVANRGVHVVGLGRPELHGHRRERRIVHPGLRHVEPADLLLEEALAEFDAARALLALDEMPDLAARPRRHDEIEPVAARAVARLRDDLDDVAVLEARAQRHDPPAHARARAPVPDVGVHEIGEIHGRRSARQRLDLALRREDVDVLRDRARCGGSA